MEMEKETTFEAVRLRGRVLRSLLKLGRQSEGKLAAKVRRSVFEESWNRCVDGLLAEGLVAAAPTGFGRARTLELTSLGTAEAEKNKAELNELMKSYVEATVQL
jgi:hypothetical protein